MSNDPFAEGLAAHVSIAIDVNSEPLHCLTRHLRANAIGSAVAACGYANPLSALAGSKDAQ
jgi:hypothetical protein